MKRTIPVLILISTLMIGVFPVAVQAKMTDSVFRHDANLFFCMARDLWAPVEMQSLGIHDAGLSDEQMLERMREAVLLLEVAVQLNPSHAMAWYDLMTLYTMPEMDDPGRATNALTTYSQIKQNDTGSISLWIRYMIDRLPDRQQREYLLEQNISTLSYYPWVQSDVLTQLGAMAFEKGDIEQARQYYNQAYSANQYNYAVLQRLLELPPPADTAARNAGAVSSNVQDRELQTQLQRVSLWRTKLKVNPFDIDAALNLIDAAENVGAFEAAKRFYEHAYNLLETIPDSEPVVHDLQVKHMIKLYNHDEIRSCIDMAETVLQRKPDDLLVNGILALAMHKTGMTVEAREILRQAQQQSLNKLNNPDLSPAEELVLTMELAWRYCFITLEEPDPASALKFAQRAHQLAPKDSSQTAAVLAYALVINQQWQQAEELVANAPANDPIAALTQAKIYLHRQQPDKAIESLSALNIHQTGILYHTINDLLDSLQDENNAANDQETGRRPSPATLNEYISNYLNSYFDDRELGLIFAPDEFIHCQLRLNTDNFAYGDPIIADVQLTNISETSLIVGPGSFLEPHILITAEVRPVISPAGSRTADEPTGQPREEIPISYRYLINHRLLEAGRNSVIQESLNIGRIREMVESHPQQEYKIILRVYVDPVIDEDGQWAGRYPSLQPAPITIYRKDFEPSYNRLKVQERFLKSGPTDDKIRSLILLGGLLQEAELARQGELNYTPESYSRNRIREWINTAMSASDPRTRAWAVYAIRHLPFSAEEDICRQAGNLLSDPNWFVRFQACWSLLPVVDLSAYLEWTANTDQNETLRRQAQYYMDQTWTIQDTPLIMPEDENGDSAAESQ